MAAVLQQLPHLSAGDTWKLEPETTRCLKMKAFVPSVCAAITTEDWRKWYFWARDVAEVQLTQCVTRNQVIAVAHVKAGTFQLQ